MTWRAIFRRQGAGRTPRLTARLTMFVTGLVGLAAATFAMVLVDSNARHRLELAETVGFELASLTAGGLSAPLANRDMSAVHKRLQELAGTNHVMAVELIDADGQTRTARVGQIAATEAELLAKAASAAGATRIAGLDGVLIIAAPVLHSDKVIGVLTFSLSEASVVGAQTGRAWLVYTLLILMAALSAPLTILYLRNTLQPLSALEAYADGLCGDDQPRPCEVTGAPEVVRIGLGFNALIERLDAAQRRVRKLSFVDAATELPNQERFAREVREQIATMLPSGEMGAVLLLSLDRLDRIAATFGQAAALELLAVAAQKLEKALRVVDAHVRTASFEQYPALPARLPGHEFGVLIPRVIDSAEADRYAQMLTAALGQPILWRDQKISFDVAAGAAIIPRDASDVDTAMRHARLALNAGRQDQRGLRFFTPALDQDAHARMTLEREMREALERNEFRAYLQPKVSLAHKDKIIGCEALARWVRPDRSMVSPGVFIPAAEETGLIGPISEAILRDACWKAAAWTRDGLKAHVAVNVSPLQFADDRFTHRVEKILEQSGLDPSLLELEITESAAMTDIAQVARVIEPLRARGVRFAIDDFGTGHSSLAVLTRLPFDMIKIDQQFIRRLSEDSQAPTIVETILAMAASLNFETVAEGIETEEQARFLRLRGCGIGQGFLYGPALPSTDFTAMLREQQTEPNKDLRGFAA